MMSTTDQTVINEYYEFLENREFPCVAAKAALAKQQVKCIVADHIACPKDDHMILNFLYDFIDQYRKSTEPFHSAAVIFKGPEVIDEVLFDRFLWQRLQCISDLDAQKFFYDQRVHSNPMSDNYSFSIKEEAFFIIGLHSSNSRPARQFKYPTLTFNPHAQFEEMRDANRYEKMKNIVRKRDLAYSGSMNPMLEDFGKSSEVYQYSGRKYDDTWQCPLKSNHAATKGDSST